MRVSDYKGAGLLGCKNFRMPGCMGDRSSGCRDVKVFQSVRIS